MREGGGLGGRKRWGRVVVGVQYIHGLNQTTSALMLYTKCRDLMFRIG